MCNKVRLGFIIVCVLLYISPGPELGRGSQRDVSCVVSLGGLHHLLYLLLELLLYLLHGRAVVCFSRLIQAGQGAAARPAQGANWAGLHAVPEHPGLTLGCKLRPPLVF